MPRSSPVDGFSLAYDRDRRRATRGAPARVARRPLRLPAGRAPAGRRRRRRRAGPAGVRGVRQAPRRPRRGVHGRAQARSVTGLLDELGLGPVVLAGYDIGSRIAQIDRAAVARSGCGRWWSPRRCPARGSGCWSPEVAREFWYQHFHRLDLPHSSWTATGTPSAATSSTSGRTGRARRTRRRTPTSTGSPMPTAQPGAFTASIGWYRQGPGILVRGLAEQAPAPTTGSPSRRTCSGRRTTRCSRPPGATASTSSSPTSP